MIDTRDAVVLLCCLLVPSHEDDLLFNITVSVGTGSEMNHVTGSLIKIKLVIVFEMNVNEWLPMSDEKNCQHSWRTSRSMPRCRASNFPI